MVETNAAGFYGFDLDRLRPIGDRIGPPRRRRAPAARPGATTRPDSTCNAFEGELAIKSW